MCSRAQRQTSAHGLLVPVDLSIKPKEGPSPLLLPISNVNTFDTCNSWNVGAFRRTPRYLSAHDDIGNEGFCSSLTSGIDEDMVM